MSILKEGDFITTPKATTAAWEQLSIYRSADEDMDAVDTNNGRNDEQRGATCSHFN